MQSLFQILGSGGKFSYFILMLGFAISAPILFFVTYYHLFYLLGEGDGMSAYGEIRPKIESNSSFVFYIPMNSSTKHNPDYRMRFWEKQLKDFTAKYERNYLGPFKSPVNGFKIINFTEGFELVDFDHCVKFCNSVKHFKNNYIDYDWFIFADSNTYINISNLNSQLKEIQKDHDPLKEVLIGYGPSPDNKNQNPNPSTGVILSNYALSALNPETIAVKQCETNMLIDVLKNAIQVKSFLSQNNFVVIPQDKIHKIATTHVKDLMTCSYDSIRFGEPIFYNIGKNDQISVARLFESPDPKLGIAQIQDSFSFCYFN
ncbi:hypothetical protein TVAG_198450 [Trichomonas vaginalis G3]|uniref:Uncharacterized protein n=1 Tax=Trichomonas vaginalis (strain ATCC PRA-98 / G3) TaxID=412133 RepID=A2DDN1_TRIV3|nr:hypothetical protein TVAGG3_0998870 [Trichomonas vaginalis G3]EAY21407.1 hypothetical protein TVAG_198450 [Trichomonas vaginalis G3]KAI5490620.1 hypothetical protein TVAGG3_0998870 [Trichomonas vaginalis G3]|eukprot:XP_001582393.1 hypothetical protein [Trichomonas vaginalis G3]